MQDKQDFRALQRRQIEKQVRQSHSVDFFNMLTGSALLDTVDELLPDHRERLYSPIDTLSLFMAQTLSADSSCQAVVDRYSVERVSQGLSACSTSTGAYCKARQRLPLELTQTLARHVGSLLTAGVSSKMKWRGHNVKLVDGTTITMPDTPENQACYPQQSNQQEGLGFPIMRAVGLLCLASGAVLDSAYGPYAGKCSSEHALFQRLFGSILQGDLIVADCYYCTYFMIAQLQQRGANILFQQHQRRRTDFNLGQRLGRQDHVVIWNKPKIRPHWISQAQFDAAPETLKLRELKVGSKIMVTSLLTKAETTRQQIDKLYQQRWNIELDLRNIKTTMGLQRLDCRSPAMNEKQWWVAMLAYNLIRLLMLESAKLAHLLPRQISFKHTVQLWIAWNDQERNRSNCENQRLLVLIAQRRVGNRPNRIEPRAVKRRPKCYPLLTQTRQYARDEIRDIGHPKKLK